MSNSRLDMLANASTNANEDSPLCFNCDQCFHMNRGLNQHLRSC